MPPIITIGPYSFPLTLGYSSREFEVGPTELAALDRLRSEKVRKKAFRRLEQLRFKTGRKTLTEGELKLLTDEVAELDRTIRIEAGVERAEGARSTLGDEGTSPLAEGAFDAELDRLVDLRIAAEEAARGITLSPSQREAAKEALRAEPLLRDQARARVEVALAEREKIMRELF